MLPHNGVVDSLPALHLPDTLLRLTLGVHSNHPLLDGDYEFRTDNIEAAQPLVSGQMAQALNWLKEAWPGEPARIALTERDGFLLLPHKKEFFELPASTVSLDYKAHIEPMITDMATILATAALVRKIGT